MSALPSAGSTQRTRGASRAQRNNTGGAESNNNAKPGRVMGRGGGDPVERWNGGRSSVAQRKGSPANPAAFFFSGCNQTGTRLPGGSASAASAGGSSALPAAGRSRIRSAQPRKRFLPSCPPPLRLAPLRSPSIQPEPPSLPHRRWETPPRQLRRSHAEGTGRIPRVGSRRVGTGDVTPAVGPAVLHMAMALPALPPRHAACWQCSALSPWHSPHSMTLMALPALSLMALTQVALPALSSPTALTPTALSCSALPVTAPLSHACSVLCPGRSWGITQPGQGR